MEPYPKIELHVHLEGTVRPATLLEIARRNDYALPADTVEGLQELYEFRDFRHFIEVWILTTNALQTSADFRQVVVDYAAEAASHGAVYLEGIFSPAERVRRGCSWQEIYEGVCDGADAARELHGVEVRLTPDIPRGFPMDEARATVEWAARYRDRGVVGVGLGGLEAEYPPEPYEDVFRLAKSLGLGSVPHAGEVAGAASVRGALEELGADRLRHGIRAEEDPGLVRELADRGTVLDVCPLSNLRTGAVHSLAEHPLPRARRRRRPLLDLDRRPGDVRHRSEPGLRGRGVVRARPALVLRRGSRGRAVRRDDPCAPCGNRLRAHLANFLVCRYKNAMGSGSRLTALAARLITIGAGSAGSALPRPAVRCSGSAPPTVSQRHLSNVVLEPLRRPGVRPGRERARMGRRRDGVPSSDRRSQPCTAPSLAANAVDDRDRRRAGDAGERISHQGARHGQPERRCGHRRRRLLDGAIDRARHPTPGTTT